MKDVGDNSGAKEKERQTSQRRDELNSLATKLICDHNYARQEYLRSIYYARMADVSTNLPYFVGTWSIYALQRINLTRVCVFNVYRRCFAYMIVTEARPAPAAACAK